MLSCISSKILNGTLIGRSFYLSNPFNIKKKLKLKNAFLVLKKKESKYDPDASEALAE